MLVILRSGAGAEALEQVVERIEQLGLRAHVSQGQFRTVVGAAPSATAGKAGAERTGSLPAAVSWQEAQRFCTALSDRSDGRLAIRLPTEAEWEYACRAGSETPYSYGKDGAQRELPNRAWYSANSESRARPVATKKPNVWGLHDMHGNMLEWCSDWYDAQYYLSSPVEDPQGPISGAFKVLRGGSWADGPELLRSARRVAARPGDPAPTYGFRVCFDILSEDPQRPFSGSRVTVWEP